MKTQKVILITGASSGMGKDAALTLIKEGHIVYGAARRVEKMKELEAAGGHALAMDITKEDQVIAAVNQVIQENGRIDVLVNNAGYAVYGAVEDTDMNDARRQFEVNLFGLARLTQEVLPHMREQHSGKIINITSIGGKIYTPLGAWYHATKHALEGWSDCLRLEVKGFGIDVVIVEPGAIQTEFGDVMMQPMIDRSSKGPYADITNKFTNAISRAFEKGDSSPASVISNVISKAIQSNKPKTRYAKGKYAGPMLFMRRWLSDRAFDRVLMSQFVK